jgi:hypothetical protein
MIALSHACHLRHSFNIVHLPTTLLEVDLVKRGPRIFISRLCSERLFVACDLMLLLVVLGLYLPVSY